MGKRGRPGIDRHEFHRLLWSRANRNKIVEISNNEYADEFNVTFEHMSRLFKELKDAGRIKKLSGRKFMIFDPAKFSDGRG